MVFLFQAYLAVPLCYQRMTNTTSSTRARGPFVCHFVPRGEGSLWDSGTNEPISEIALDFLGFSSMQSGTRHGTRLHRHAYLLLSHLLLEAANGGSWNTRFIGNLANREPVI